MSFGLSRFQAQEHVFRGIEDGGINKKANPRTAKLKCFYRKEKDTDGVTVLPKAHLCCKLRIIGITRLVVGEVESLLSPISGEPLWVYQDAPDHAFIDNVPFKHEHPKEAEDVATLLAGLAELLEEEEYVEAKRIAAADRPQAPEEETQESFRWGPE